MPHRYHHQRGSRLSHRLVNPFDSTHPLQLGRDPYVLLDTWIILYSLSQALLLLLLGTLVFRKRVGHARGSTLINMLVTMLLHTVVSCLLYYGGEQANPSPPQGLCLAQATLKHGTGPMVIAAEFCLALHLFLSIRALIKLTDDSRLIVKWLLVVPYLTAITWALPVAVRGVMDPINVERLLQSYYCSYNDLIYGDISTLFGVVVIFSTAGILTWIAAILIRSWSSTRKLRASGTIDVSLIVRLCIFVALQIIYIGVTVVGLAVQEEAANHVIEDVSTILEALTPTFSFMLFGLRWDMLAIWFSWLKPCLPKRTPRSFSLSLPHFLTPEIVTSMQSPGIASPRDFPPLRADDNVV